MQACATGARALLAAVQEVEVGTSQTRMAITCDRTSNGPHLYYPNPRGPGGTGAHEDWVMDNFGCDPLGQHSMLQTAENVATKHQIPTAEQHDVVLRREAQYRDALADDSAFQKRFMSCRSRYQIRLSARRWRRSPATRVSSFSTAEGLAKLKPVMEGGSVTFGGQTHPADGNAAHHRRHARARKRMSRDPKIRIRLLGFGAARAELAYMPEAPIPAARGALAQADLSDRAHGRDQDAQSVRR